MVNTNMLCFDTLVSESASVRLTKDTPPLIWAVDLVMTITGKSRDVSGCILLTMTPDAFDPAKIIKRNLEVDSDRAPMTKLVTLEHAIELVMAIPGPTTKSFRMQACDIIRSLAVESAETAHNATARIGLVAACEAFLSDALVAAKTKRKVDTEIGYVYGSVPEAFPDLIKIGATRKVINRTTPQQRFLAVAPTYHAARDERMAHAYFADRHEANELYHVTAQELQAFFDCHIAPEYEEGVNKRHGGHGQAY